MKEIELDASRLIEKENAHYYLKGIFGFDDDYGNNLDALNDSLYSVEEEVEIRINKENLNIISNNDYAYIVLKIINDVCNNKKSLSIVYTLEDI